MRKDEEVETDIQLTNEAGEPINLPMQKKGKVGNARSFPAVVSIALINLRSGETGEYITTAHAISNGRAKQLGLEPNDIIKMTIKATAVPEEEKAEEKKDEKKAETAAPAPAAKDAAKSKKK